MKITKIETFCHWIEWCNWLFVKVSTDEGLYGWGEGSIAGPIRATETAIHELGQVLIGHDPAGVEQHWQRMYNAWRWRGGAVGQTALSALDIALWDLEGKRLGVPVYRLLGGPFRERHRVYASHWLAGVKTPEEAYEGAREAVRRGFKGFKWIPFRASELRDDEAAAIRRGAELMAAAREGAGPDVEIYIECAEFLSPRTAVLAAEALKPYRPAWFEEPIPFENIICSGRSAGTHAGSDRNRRAAAIALRVSRIAGAPSRRYHPAGSDARRRYHRGQEDRGDGGYPLCERGTA